MKSPYLCLITLVLLLSSLVPTALADTLDVPAQYTTIQSAIDAALSGDTVLVAPGLYVENLDFKGKAITVMSSDGPEVTTIDGGSPVDPNFGSVVMFRSNEGASSLLTGFTLSKGTGTHTVLPDPHKYSDWVGGAVFCYDAHPRIINNIMVGNATVYGGGIGCVHHANPLIEGNKVLDNKGEFGTGITCIDSSEPIITQNMVQSGSSSYTGGGFYIWDSAPKIMNNLIKGNAAGYGGGLACIDASPLITNNIFLENGGGYGGAIYCGFDSAPKIVNNTFFNNKSSNGKALCSWRSSASVMNSIFSDSEETIGPEILIGTTTNPSTFSISYSNLKGGLASLEVEPGCTLHWGDGMINSDPLFVDSSVNDLHLTFNSPCRGSGCNRVKSDYDFEGDPRIAYGTIDMGADEFHPHLYYTGEATPGGEIKGKICGLPGTPKTRLYFGSAVLPQPISTPWGYFYLQAPLDFVWLGTIPSTGVMVLPAQIPGSPAAPYDIPMQALVGVELTNHCVLEIR